MSDKIVKLLQINLVKLGCEKSIENFRAEVVPCLSFECHSKGDSMAGELSKALLT